MRIVLITAIVVMIGFVDGNPAASKDELQNRIFGLLPFVQKGLCVGNCATFSCAVPIARCNIPFNLIFELDKLLVVDLIRKFPQYAAAGQCLIRQGGNCIGCIQNCVSRSRDMKPKSFPLSFKQ